MDRDDSNVDVLYNAKGSGGAGTNARNSLDSNEIHKIETFKRLK